MKKLSCLAIIPARSGSKRLKHKNTLNFLGKPMIAHSILSGMASNYIQKVIVSTDSRKIASFAKRYGAEIPFLRPKKLATDRATSADVVLHAIKHFQNLGQEFDWVILLQPTSPLRLRKDIDQAFKILLKTKSDAILSVCERPVPSNCIATRRGKYVSKSKGSERHWIVNGAIYIVRTKVFLKYKTFIPQKTSAYYMPPERSVDIDSPADFAFAKQLANLL